MNKRYIIPFVLVFVLMSFAMASADGYGYCYDYGYGYCNDYCYGYGYNCNQYYYPYCNGSCYPAQPVTRECASFVTDVTIPDGSYIAPGSTFTKTWRIRNNGTTTWTTKYKLVFVSGTQMSNVSYVNLPYNVQPGQTVDISVQMTAPKDAGSYKSEWKLVNESGSQFGVGSNCQTAVYAEIVNYVRTYSYNYNWCAPQPPCYGWNCYVPGFDHDGWDRPKPPRDPMRPPRW